MRALLDRSNTSTLRGHLKYATANRSGRDRQIELVATFADQTVTAIQNAQLFEQVQERTRELSQSLDELRTAQNRLVQTESPRRSANSRPASRRQ